MYISKMIKNHLFYVGEHSSITSSSKGGGVLTKMMILMMLLGGGVSDLNDDGTILKIRRLLQLPLLPTSFDISDKSNIVQ